MGDLLQNREMKSSSRLETVIWAVKLMFLSVGIVSTFMLFKVSIIPYLFNLILSMLSRLPSLWISIKSLLSPPYIYILLNFIIITIAASSSYEGHNHQRIETQRKRLGSKISDPRKTWTNSLLADIGVQIVGEDEVKEEKEEKPICFIEKETDPTQQTRSVETKMEDLNFVAEKTMTTTMEEEGEADTMEETWRLIMGEKGKTMKKELKKSETWDVAPQTAVETEEQEEEDDDDPVSWAQRELRKSDTFSDRASYMRREKSMSQEELNRRAEAFIKKINNEIRLQRQESDQRHRVRDMVY